MVYFVKNLEKMINYDIRACDNAVAMTTLKIVDLQY